MSAGPAGGRAGAHLPARQNLNPHFTTQDAEALGGQQLVQALGPTWSGTPHPLFTASPFPARSERLQWDRVCGLFQSQDPFHVSAEHPLQNVLAQPAFQNNENTTEEVLLLGFLYQTQNGQSCDIKSLPQLNPFR